MFSSSAGREATAGRVSHALVPEGAKRTRQYPTNVSRDHIASHQLRERRKLKFERVSHALVPQNQPGQNPGNTQMFQGITSREMRTMDPNPLNSACLSRSHHRTLEALSSHNSHNYHKTERTHVLSWSSFQHWPNGQSF